MNDHMRRVVLGVEPQALRIIETGKAVPKRGFQATGVNGLESLSGFFQKIMLHGIHGALLGVGVTGLK